MPKPPSYFFHDVMLNKAASSKSVEEIIKKTKVPLNVTKVE